MDKKYLPAAMLLPEVIRWIREALSLIGDAQTAKDTIGFLSVPGVTIHWDFIFQCMFLYGVIWLVGINWGWISRSWKARRRRARKELIIPGTGVVNYIVESSHSGRSFRGDRKYSEATRALEEKIKAGKLTVGVLQGGSVEPILKKQVKDITLKMFPAKSYGSEENGAARVIPMRGRESLGEEIYFDEDEILKMWPGYRTRLT